jgi:hypothetical protein
MAPLIVGRPDRPCLEPFPGMNDQRTSTALDQVDELHALLAAPTIDWTAVHAHAIALARIADDARSGTEFA